MTKEVFLRQLRENLSKRGVRSQSAEVYVRRFERILDETPADKVEQRVATFGKPEDLAARICSQLKNENPEAVKETPPAAPAAAAHASSPAPKTSVPAGKPGTAASSAPPRQAAPQRQQSAAGKAASPAVAPAKSGKTARTAPPRGAGDRGEQDPAMSDKGKKVFWWSLCLSSPIWGFLLCVIGAIFLLAYVAVIGLAALLVIGEVVLVVGGALIAIIGIVYGVMQMLPGAEASYIGLYELGLGIRNGGVTMLVSILVYNVVVNLTPIALKQLTRFAKFTAKKLWQLLLYIRKECGKL